MRPLFLLPVLAAPVLAAQPSPYLDWSLTPERVEAACAEALAKSEARLAGLAGLAPEARDFANTVKGLDRALDDLSSEATSPTFLKYVSTDKAVRDAGHACETKVEQYLVDVFTRDGLYAGLKAYAAKKEALGPVEARLLEKTLLEFKRNGLDLPPVQRERVKLLKKQLVELEALYGKNLNEVTAFLPATKEELEGLPEDYVSRLEKTEDGRSKVTLNYPDYYPFMENARSAEARRKLEALYYQRGYPENAALLQEALVLRGRIAELLGYPDMAHYVLEVRMAKDPKAVRRFLERLEKKLKAKAKPELASVLERKKADGVRSPEFLSYDFSYYKNQLKKDLYELDDEKIREYFPLHVVTRGMLEVYQKLLDLEFKEVRPAEAWHPDVQLFAVQDRSTGEPLGHFYMDLFPREGKYKHAAAFTLVGGRRDPEGNYRTPVAAMVANFNKPTAERPSLLKHDEVETFFHEFGHIMHQVLTRAEHPRFAGTRVARDFVEAPSQMLENWVWEPEVLAKLSGHWKDETKKLPAELLERMVAAKNHLSGLRYLRQVQYATVDQLYHDGPVADAAKVYHDTYNRITLAKLTEGAQPQASFGHLMGGYEASYYGYLWSEVYAADMFTRFKQAGILDAATGLRYRRLILEPGGSKDEAAQLREFLGREPNEDAFLKSIGLE